jgi:hypothetical protein
LLFAGEADGLARESSADEIDSLELAGVEGADVSMTGNIGPMLREDSLAVGVPFNLPGAGHPGSLEPEIESADARKEGSKPHPSTA